MKNQRHYIIISADGQHIWGDVYSTEEQAEEVLRLQLIGSAGQNPRWWHVDKRGDTVPQAAL